MPLFWLSLAFILGLLLASLSRAPWQAWMGLGLLASLSFLAWRLPWPPLPRLLRRDRRLKFPPILLLLALAAGGLRYELAHQPPTRGDLAFYNARGPAEITAWVAEPPDARETVTLLRLRVENIAQPASNPALPVTGLILAMRPAGETYNYGDRLLLSGQPVDPPETGDFSYRDYLARQGIYTYLAYPRIRPLEGRAGSPLLFAIFALRDRAHQVIQALFPPPEAPLLDGILLGLDRGLPEEIVTAFRRTGTSHIIAISGFNYVCV